jgi:mono/diheme cytochrome c family protein
MRVSGRSLRHLSLFLLAVLLASVGLSGCGTHYPAGLRYGVRHDPLVLKDLNSALPEQDEPDRPGQFPILSMKSLLDPRNPMHADRDKLTDEYLRNPNLLSDKDREEIEKALDEAFGTPANPKVQAEGVSANDLGTLGLDEETLHKGSRLYRVHCLHCHGVTGDGRGPTSLWINPHPRDFRMGMFKFQSVNQGQGKLPPRRDDLMRTLEHGVEGTAMPAFTLLSDAQRENLASYVIHLSIRGKTEFSTIQYGFVYDKDNNTLTRDTGDPETANLGKYCKAQVAGIVSKWVEAETSPIELTKDPYPFKLVNFDLLDRGDAEQTKNFEVMKKSVHDGHKIFLDPLLAKCETCHVDFGRRARWKYDEWGTLVKPADLTRGVYRGGRRPIDLFYRLHSGINGSGMAPFGGPLSSRQLWDVVNFLQVLPYPGMRQKFELAVK